MSACVSNETGKEGMSHVPNEDGGSGEKRESCTIKMSGALDVYLLVLLPEHPCGVSSIHPTHVTWLFMFVLSFRIGTCRAQLSAFGSNEHSRAILKAGLVGEGKVTAFLVVFVNISTFLLYLLRHASRYYEPQSPRHNGFKCDSNRLRLIER